MPKTRPFQMRASEEFLAKIDDWRRLQPDIPSRAEAIRRLIELGLSASASRRHNTKEGDMKMKTLFAAIGLAALLATTAASAQTSSTYSCADVQHIHAPPTHECTYSSPTYASTQSCGWVEHIHGAREYRCNDTSTVRPGSINPDAVSIVRGRP